MAAIDGLGPTPWQEILTGFDVLAITLLCGGVASALWLLPSRSLASVSETAIRQRLGGFVAVMLALLTLTTPAWLLARSLTLSGQPVTALGAVVPLVLTHTDFGRVWILRAASVLLLWLAWSRWRTDKRSSYAPWLLLVLIVIVAWTRSASGHPGDHGDFRRAVWMDCLHLIAAGLWGGVIIAFVVAVRPELRRDLRAEPQFTAAVVKRLSATAAIGLFLVAATGVYNAWRALGGWQPLWTSHYGRILDVKTGLVILMALLGASNRFRHVPHVIAAAANAVERALPRAFRGLAISVTVEALLMLAILAAVALLLHAMPPATMPRMP